MLSRPCGWRPLWGPRCPHILSSHGPAVTGNPLEGYGLTLEQSLPKEGRSGKHALSWESLAAAHSSENRLPFPQGHGPLSPGEANAPGPLLCPDKAQDRLGLPVASGPDTGVWGGACQVGFLQGRDWKAPHALGTQLGLLEVISRFLLRWACSGGVGSAGNQCGWRGRDLPVISTIGLQSSGVIISTNPVCWLCARPGFVLGTPHPPGTETGTPCPSGPERAGREHYPGQRQGTLP